MKPNKLTLKQQKFVDGKVAGLGNKDAGIAAGYSRGGIDVAVAGLMKHAGIKKAIAAARKEQLESSVKAKPGRKPASDAPVLRAHYKDSLDFMRDCMNNAKLPAGLRFEAAKNLLPYENARVGEAGKKEKATERAHKAAGGKYQPAAAPSNVTPIKRA